LPLYDAALKSFASGLLNEAEQHCLQALSTTPAHADSLHLLGLIYATTNRLDSGVELIGQAIRNDPTNPDYFSNLGTLLQRQGRFDEAFKSYHLALELKPDFVIVWIRLGDLLTKQDRFDEALVTYGRAAALDAQNAGVFCNIGGCLCKLKKAEEAIPWFRKAAELHTGNVKAHIGLGVALIDLDRFDEALAHLERAREIEPDSTEALNNLGVVLINLERFDEALSVLDRVLTISPNSAIAFSKRSLVLLRLGRLSEALAASDRAIALNPEYAEAHHSRARCLDAMLAVEEASSSFRNALDLDPHNEAAHWHFALNRLRAGDFKPGWIESEWRWKCKGRGMALRHRTFAQPLWLGREPIEGKTLLLHNDQGLGDAMQFCRYAPLAAARGCRVILEVDPPLRDLCGTLEGVSEIIVQGETLPAFDYHCPLFSLPLAFDTRLDTIPSTVPYLSTPGNVRDWQAWFGPVKRPRVGLVWAGNPKHGNDHNRSIALEMLLPLLDVEAQFVSVQKDPRPGDAAVLRTRGNVLDASPELKSFSDTAALLSHIDLLITVDTSMAHLAGALGRPAWVLLPRVPDWRWLLDRNDSPWYPSLRLFRQTDAATWPPVVQQVKQTLQTMIAG
jgi:tetratricopeptide (TPR) repeat protein